jgi:hypothetical protein
MIKAILTRLLLSNKITLAKIEHFKKTKELQAGGTFIAYCHRRDRWVVDHLIFADMDKQLLYKTKRAALVRFEQLANL